MSNPAKEFFQQWPERMGKAKTAMPEVARGFGSLFQATMKPGKLSVREKELIAFGIAMAVRCEPCINVHVQKCLEAGASPEEVFEAASVAVMMQGGPTYTWLPKVVEAIEAVKGE